MAMPRLVTGLAIAALLLILPAAPPPGGAQAQSVTGQPLPRFVSLKASHVRLRAGPSLEHRILWEYRGLAGMPVEVIAETERWRQVRDVDGDTGWVHVGLLQNERGAVVRGPGIRLMLRRPREGATPVARLEPGVVGRLGRCNAQWCAFSAQGYAGFVARDALWGVYPHEFRD
jgi:SH3-like domain-containing protein